MSIEDDAEESQAPRLMAGHLSSPKGLKFLEAAKDPVGKAASHGNAQRSETQNKSKNQAGSFKACAGKFKSEGGGRKGRGALCDAAAKQSIRRAGWDTRNRNVDSGTRRKGR